MEKLAVRILRHLVKSDNLVSLEDLKDKFGKNTGSALSYLEKEDYIKQGTVFRPRAGTHPNNFYQPNGMFQITSKGRAFLQEKPGKDFDRWISRVSILVSILGGALLSKPLWALVDLIVEWVKKVLE